MAFGRILTSTLLVVAQASAQSLTLRGTLGVGACTAVDAVDTVAYTTTSGLLRCIKLSDPAHPAQLGQASTGAGTVSAVEVEGSYAFGAGQGDGLVIVRISNPAAPSYITRFMVGSAVRDVAASDTLVAVATAANVVLIGVRTPATPHILATYGRAASWIEFASGGRRLHVGSNAGAYSLNVNVTTSGGDTTFALALGEEYGNDALTPVALCGDFVDVVRTPTLVALHASTYSAVGQRQSPAAIRALTASAGFSFLALSNGSVEYVDQRGNTPLWVTTAAVPGTPNALTLSNAGGQRLLVAAHSGGLTVYEYDALSTPEERPPVAPSQLALTAFPNPFNAAVVLRIEPVQPADCRLRIYDLLGREVWRERLRASGSTTLTVDFSLQPAGLYLAELRTGERTAVVKLLYLP
jgi:hypothetical protein